MSNNRKASETSESILHDNFRVFLDTAILVLRPALTELLLWEEADVDILAAESFFRESSSSKRNFKQSAEEKEACSFLLLSNKSIY